jgi:rod shape-determining protein MreC
VKIPKILILGLLLLFACLLIYYRPLIQRSSVNLIGITEPVLKILTDLTKPSESRNKRQPALRENALLKKELKASRAEVSKLKSVESENRRLRDLLELSDKSSYDSIAAVVIAKSISNWSFSVIIDKGRNDGVTDNMPIIAPAGVAGKVSEAGPSVSKAVLITDPNLKIAAAVLRSREEGIVAGTGRGLCRMLYLSVDADVKKGDKIVTAGYSGIFPKNLLLGEVVSVGTDIGKLYKYAVIKPAVDPFKLEEVLCIH